MSQLPQSTRTESPMLRFTIAVLVFVVIAGTGAGYFSNVFENVELTEAEASIQGYAASIINIRKNWIMQGRPDKVLIRGLTRDGKPGNQWVFLMNKAGWPINVIDGTDKPDCKALWYALQKGERLEFSGTAVKLKPNASGELEQPGFNPDIGNIDRSLVWVCQNIVAQQLHFRYRLDTGKVELE